MLLWIACLALVMVPPSLGNERWGANENDTNFFSFNQQVQESVNGNKLQET